ncbi:unnamed protein product [Gongylonema pulchrum]|uniref:PDZ domain-containing protein n=1 Tax=Gongylonema pulchrum TaxID=637853 RepID=A0A183D8B9_9BILA|nr:unnamed protein product [Gongylonema pulchrum]
MLTINRQKGEAESENKIDRYVIELKRENDGEPFGIVPVVEEDTVIVGKVTGIAAFAGVKEKDQIKRVNGEAVQSVADFEQFTRGQQKIVLYIVRGAKIVKSTKVELEAKVHF